LKWTLFNFHCLRFPGHAPFINYEIQTMRRGIQAVLLFVLSMLSTGCASDAKEPVQRLEAGPYRVELLAPGGTLRQGTNDLEIRVTHAGGPMAVTGGALTFTMPAMGTMPAMRAPAALAPGASEEVLGGTVTLGMGGGWNAALEVQTERGPLRGSFGVRVVD
jgi:hypothetical protein